MTVFVSMLRGVNVGGHGSVKAGELTALYESLGFADVRAVLQSGNVIFRSNLGARKQLTVRIAQELERRLGLTIEVLVRTLEEIAMIVDRGPILAEPKDRSKLLVMFLGAVPDARATASLLKQHAGPEVIEPRGPEIYLYYPNGIGRSKLSGAFIESKLGVPGTARNWNTLTKLLAVGREIEQGEPRPRPGQRR